MPSIMPSKKMMVFISYAMRRDADRTFFENLVEALRKAGMEPRSEDLQTATTGGDPEKMKKELSKYDFVVAVLSKSYMEDEWLQAEMLFCKMFEMEKRKPYIFPVVTEDCYVTPLLRRNLTDFRGIQFEEGYNRLSAIMPGSRQIFVVMKFGDPELDSTYAVAVKPVSEEFNYDILRIDEVQDSGAVMQQVIKEIKCSAIVLADLTDERPNCYYEVGYAHAFGKELILTAKEGAIIHFDIAGYRVIIWKTPKELQDKLRERLLAIEKRRSGLPEETSSSPG